MNPSFLFSSKCWFFKKNSVFFKVLGLQMSGFLQKNKNEPLPIDLTFKYRLGDYDPIVYILRFL